jgi:hypothetical protein
MQDRIALRDPVVDDELRVIVAAVDPNRFQQRRR